jgi:hypothetical protein
MMLSLLVVSTLTVAFNVQLSEAKNFQGANEAIRYSDKNFNMSLVFNAAESDLDIPLPTGSHIYVDYYSSWSDEDKTIVNGWLETYLPKMADEFWELYRDAFVTMTRAQENRASGWINYDERGNIVSYGGNINICSVSLHTLLHEWTHLFQFWIPNYRNVIGTHLEAVANAFANALILEQLGWNTQEYQIVEGYTGQLIFPLDHGYASYLKSTIYRGYHLLRGWEELWYYDHEAFKKFNAYVASLPQSSNIGLRDAICNALFQEYPDYAYDGLDVDTWLNGFSFFNSLSDIPLNKYLAKWGAISTTGTTGTSVGFGGELYVNRGSYAEEVSVSSFDITIRDGYTSELLYYNMGQPGFGGYYEITNSTASEIIRIDLVVHLVNGDNLPITGYAVSRGIDERVKSIFFLNREGFVEGNGSSNVGAVNNGLIKWVNGSDVRATVTWSGGTYTYTINNIMVHPAVLRYVPTIPIAVELYKARIYLWPLIQLVDPHDQIRIECHISPLVSTGNLTLYHSTDNVNWTPIACATPINGYASFKLQISQSGLHYFKAQWDGDGIIDPSQSSTVKVEVPTANYTLSIVATTGGNTCPMPGTYTYMSGTTISVTAIPEKGFSFGYWLLDGNVRTENPITVIMDSNHALEAYFVDDVPPEISEPWQDPPPNNVQPFQNVTIWVNVTDYGTGIKNVTLWYSIDNGTSWIILNMTALPIPSDSWITYEATIKGYENCTWVTYKIVAYDNAGNNATKDNNGYGYQYHVIPEFPTTSILILLILTTLITTTLWKTKRKHHPP